MRRSRRRLVSLDISILAVLTLSQVLTGQASPDRETGIPTDWSSHHVIFSKPATAEQAKRVEKDPRYWQQQHRQSLTRLPEAVAGGASASELQPDSKTQVHRGDRKLRRDWSEDLGSGGTVGAGNYPAKYSFSLITANCASATQPDFTVYATGLAGSLTQASIVAYDNLYSGCTGIVPTVYWAYDTLNGTVNTSPVFSVDGTQLAFVQATPAAGAGIFVILKWAPSTTDTVANPTPLTRTLNGDYPTCAPPCFAAGNLQDGSGTTNNSDTNSSIFYDYLSDTAYVGDDAGWLHQITPVFNGVPAEVKSGGWPVQVNPLNPTALTSPVYDNVSGVVFVADAGGFLYRVGPGTDVAMSAQLDFSMALDGGPGIVQGPVVDRTNELVYVFAPSDGSGLCTGGADCTAVFELAADFPEGAFGAESLVGASTVSGEATPNPLYIGGFDSTYLNSVGGTGNLYVCGNTGGSPTLYQVSIVAGLMAASGIAGPFLSNSPESCSPVTDFMNPNAGGGNEWLYASVEDVGIASGCSVGGCIFNFKDTPWLPSTVYTVGQEILDSHFQIQAVAVGGTSGATVPTWQHVGLTTTDGTVQWICQGVASAITLPAWLAGHSYSLHNKILDNNNNVQFASTAGKSGGTIPTFNQTPGGTTSDGTNGLVWTNIGSIATADMPASGGTSGIIIDNTVGTGTLAGASQVYFSTLSDQSCGTSGTGGCAVQSSQAGLH